MEIIEGTVTNIIFRSANGYSVLEIEGNTPTTVVGTLPEIQTGEYVRFFGCFKEHKTYGIQFAATSFESTLPADIYDMEMFLAGGFIKGIGEVLASRIVESFGEETFKIIEEDWMSLTAIKGISRSLAENIHNAFVEYTGSKDSYAKLMGLGLTAKQAVIVFNALGPGAAEVVKNNPYLLISYVRGIDYITADLLAQKIGITGNNPVRIQSAIIHVLKKSLNLGHTNVPEDKLISTIVKKLEIDNEDVLRALDALTVDGRIIRKKYNLLSCCVFLQAVYDAEHSSSIKIIDMMKAGIRQKVHDLESKLHLQQKKYHLSDEQIDALEMVLNSPVSILTGGPGTGKTTILRALTNILAVSGNTFELCAPTGRAAKRMAETCLTDAKTIHRLLEYSYEKDSEATECVFRRNAENPLDCGTLIVDEASMIDVFLLKNLLDALIPGTRLVIVGDANQLPSVGPGSVMEDILTSGIIPVSKLTHIFRNDGGIAAAAYNVLAGEMPVFNNDIQFIEENDENSICCLVNNIYEQLYEDGTDVQMLTPIKDTIIGARSLDIMLRDLINPANPGKEELSWGEHTYRVGDRVMQIKNNYAREWYMGNTTGQGVFNGDIGEIIRISGGSIHIDFEGRIMEYEPLEFEELAGAYAYTIHKSQGNEFDAVILPMKYANNAFFSRNLLYTAITRAKKKVFIVGSKKSLLNMINNSQTDKRYTALKEEIQLNAEILM